MAKFKKKRITEDLASKTLGELRKRGNLTEGWEILNYNGRPRAKAVGYYSYGDIRTDLAPEKTSEFRTTDGQVITDKFFWPKQLGCEIDLADFYVDENGTFQHPLYGFHIKKLVEITQYPFYNQDRVIAILVRFSSNLILNPKEPDAVVFIECWSHFDDYDTITYDSPSEAFKIPLTAGTLWTGQFEDKSAHIGKNFIILPFGYCYDEAMEERDKFTTEEWNQLCTKNATKWSKIIQDFLEGNEATAVEATESETASDDQNAKADSNGQNANPINTQGKDTTENVTPPVNPAEPSLTIPSLTQWQERQRAALRDRFLRESHIRLCEESECILQERDDQNGVQIYQIAPPDSRTDSVTDTGLFTEMICINGIWYCVTNFLYCRKHYAAFLKFLRAVEKEDLEIRTKIDELDQ